MISMSNKRKFRRGRKATLNANTRDFMHPREALQIRGKDEVKSYDTVFVAAGITSPGTVTDCSAVPIGTSEQQRVGASISLTGVTYRCAWFQNGASSNRVRSILFRWNPPSASLAPTAGAILQFTTSTYASSSPYAAANAQQEQFQVLLDKSFAVSGNGDQIIAFDFEKLFRDAEIRFDSGLTSGVGKVYLLLISDAAATAPSHEGTVRIFYTDS